MAVEETPKVVEGTVIRTSRGTLFFLCACSGLLAFVAGLILWDMWGRREGERVLPFHLAKDSLHTSFGVALCVFGGVAGLILLAYKSLFPHQLILGEEVLQVVRTGLFGPTVETQVPYANIAVVACERESYGFRQLEVGIDLLHVGAPGTYSCTRGFGEKNKNGRDLYLPRFFTAGPEEIAVDRGAVPEEKHRQCGRMRRDRVALDILREQRLSTSPPRSGHPPAAAPP